MPTAAIEPAAVVTIAAVVLVVLALVFFLVMTIVQLRKITQGLDVVLGAVGEIVSKTAPVNGVVDGLNVTLAQGRDLLEGLLVKKAGADAAGLVESVFPGEGAKFGRRFDEAGSTERPIGEVYPRGEAILNSLLGATPAPAAVGAPAAPPERMSATSERPWERSAPAEEAPPPGPEGPEGSESPEGSEPPAGPKDEEPGEPGRVTVRGRRPWES